MATSVYAATTTGSEMLASSAPHTSGAVRVRAKEVQVPETHPTGEPKSKPKNRYRHIAAAHKTCQPSTLSQEAEASPSFIGFRNLMVLVLIVMNLRLALENWNKYGVLITLSGPRYSKSDIFYGVGLYALIPIHLFIAYVIELVAAEIAKGAVERRRRSDAGINAPETERDKKEFKAVWRWIAAAHALNATLCLGITNIVVYYYIHNPGLGSMCELHAIVVWLKNISYAFTNRDLRHAILHPSTQSNLPEIYSKCPYPRNITIQNLIYFWFAPTLVYQPVYPRTSSIRWSFVFKRVMEVIGISVFIWLATAQYAAPVLRNSLDKMASLDLTSILERVMKLSTISLIIWLAGFFALFQSFLNALAEVTRFGDRNFYDDWWNSTNLQMYWSTWNKPVYHFMRRHVFSPLVGRGWGKQTASAIVFVFSGFLHELVVGVPTHNILGVAFLGMVIQLPLIAVTAPLTKMEGRTGKVLGNCIFWISFVLIGQPLAALLYFFAWQSSHGNISKAPSSLSSPLS